MSKKYQEIINDLEDAIKRIEYQGISIEPLNKAVDELKSHSENISAIEDNIDAVKSEVINPIKTELNENKKAGKFSIWGFYVGAFGLIVTAISLLYTTFGDEQNELHRLDFKDFDSVFSVLSDNEIYLKINNIEKSLNELTYTINGLNDNYQPQSDEYLLGQFKSAVFLKQDSNKLIVQAYVLAEKEIDNKWYPFVCLRFFINEKQIGVKGLKEKIKIINNSGVVYYKDDWSSIWLSENDEFIFNGKYRFRIKRIFRRKSQILTVCDRKNEVLIERIK